MRADRLPAGIRVAILAGDRDRPMRVGHLGLGTAHGGTVGIWRRLQSQSKTKGEQSQTDGD